MAEQKYVPCREFTVTVVSAQNLPNVHRVSKPKVYAKVSLGSDRKTEQRTRPDKHGKLNPTWNKKMEYIIEESDVMHYSLQLVIKFYFKRKLARDLYIGETHMSIKKLYKEANKYNRGGSAQLYRPIENGSSDTGGKMCFQCRFGKIILVKESDFWKRILDAGASFLGRVVGAAVVGGLGCF